MKFRNVYWSRTALDLDQARADILAVGDSWFWYPFPGGSLINAIGALVEPMQHNILVAGHNGAEAYDYVKGKHKRQVDELLRRYGSGARALLVSGGGNDFAGFNDLRPMLLDDCSACRTARDCFIAGDAEGTEAWLMQRLHENVALLIHRALRVMPADAAVVLHSYDYAVPDGRGEPWLQPALLDARVPPALQHDCIRLLVDDAAAAMQQLVDALPGRIMLADSRGTLDPADWANELHPKPRGFAKIAAGAWRPVLARIGLCAPA